MDFVRVVLFVHLGHERTPAHELPISAARDHLTDVVNSGAYGGSVTYVTRLGRRLAAIVPAETMEAIEAAEDAADVEDADAAMNEPGESAPWNNVKAEAIDHACNQSGKST